jgi:hypothetical protein
LQFLPTSLGKTIDEGVSEGHGGLELMFGPIDQARMEKRLQTPDQMLPASRQKSDQMMRL